MASDAWILVGAGGAGSNIVHRIQNHIQMQSHSVQIATVGVDSDLNDLRQAHLENTVKIGGVSTVGQLLNSLGKENEVRQNVESRLPDLALKFSMNEGAGQIFELGQLAFEASKNDVKQAILNAFKLIPRSRVNVAIVGSLCGGTASAVVPAVAQLIHSMDSLSDRLVKVVGYGLCGSCFRGFLSSSQSESLDRNEYLSLAEIKRSAESFFDFKSIEASPGSLASRRIGLSFDLAESLILGDLTGVRIGSTPATDSLLLTNDTLTIFRDSSTNIGSSGLSNDLSKFEEPSYLRKIVHRMGQVSDFEKLVDDPSVRESEIQSFLEKNQEIITGTNYEKAEAHVILESADGSRMIPDFMLIPFEGGLAEILELKMPKVQLTTRKGVHDKLTSNVEAAIAQLRSYSDFFEQSIDRDKFHETYGFTTFRPKLSLLIGRSPRDISKLKFRKLVSGSKDVQIETYDDLISKAKRLAKF